MKRSIAAIVALSLLLAGCGTYSTPEARPYQSYGPFNASTYKSKNVCYEVSAWSIIWGIVLVETIVAPIYFFGYNLYNPTRLKKSADDDCSADS